MARNSKLYGALPVEVEDSLRRLGSNLRTARLRRNMSLDRVAQSLGIGRKIIIDAERGKASTGIAVYWSLMWAYGLLGQAADLIAPTSDQEGVTLASIRERQKSRLTEAVDNDF